MDITNLKLHVRTHNARSAGKSLLEAPLFFRKCGEPVVYKNCSEYQKQFLNTTCSPQV